MSTDLARAAQRAAAARRLLPVVAAVCVGVAAAGFVQGLSPVSPQRPPARVAATPSAPRAPTYTEMGSQRRGLNGGMYHDGLDDLRRAIPSASVRPTAADRQAALDARATRRAYNGAPPTIPHEVGQQTLPDCLSCHATGVAVAGKVAPRMSHQRHDSCLQCHVVSADPRPVASTPPAPETTFVGLPSPSGGQRAWPGAPPTIPHSTHMRTECLSCHGPAGPLGLRTSHPERQSCQQCHGPSAQLDQRPPVALSRPPAPAPEKP